MEKLPHTYKVEFKQEDRLILSDTESAPTIVAGAPPQFDGDPKNWSPESLFLASIGQCLFLTFVSITRASKFAFSDYESSITGTLEKTDHGVAFTEALIKVRLTSEDTEKAKKLLEKAEKNCLIANSINFKTQLEVL